MSTETETRTGVYEVMFLASQAAAASFGDLVAHINHLIERANGEVVAMKKWDERRLAYEIDKQKRGVYILAYLKMPTDMIAHLERDVQISDQVMRVLITSADHLTEEEMKAHDDRSGLDTEAKLKAEQGDSADSERSSKARLGAPEQKQAEAVAAVEADAKQAAQPAPAAEESSDSDEAPSDSEGDAEKKD